MYITLIHLCLPWYSSNTTFSWKPAYQNEKKKGIKCDFLFAHNTKRINSYLYFFPEITLKKQNKTNLNNNNKLNWKEFYSILSNVII